ncbi:S8 family serine peptidase [bacterium]|nr:S8 family serine peptidase [candidate division CSSED10-310 bacterium]
MKSLPIVIAICISLILCCHANALVPRAVFSQNPDQVIRSCERWDLLVVKFVEGSGVRLRAGRLISRTDADMSEISDMIAAYPDTRIARLFQRPEELYEMEKRSGERMTGRELADLNLYYAFGPATRQAATEILNALNRLDIVEVAYPEPVPEPAWLPIPDVLVPPSYVDSQDYLEASPIGVDAYAGWTYPGGKGENVQMIDVELAWNWTHHDLPDPFFTGGTPSSELSYLNHGTAVLGEIRGIENEFGVTGISPLVPVGGVAIAIGDWPENVASWFDMASAALNPGDVWLIELHGPGPGGDYVCMEYWQANYDAIANSTAQGRICVEAGGNGSADLDNPIYEGKFDRTVRDSLAVLVGAGTPYAMQPEWFTNYGSRMDANGWGSEIVTTGYGDLYSSEGQDYWYTADFGGTSGASPMVVGVCCVAQSVYKSLSGGNVLDPLTLRSAITETGAPQPEPVTQYIGPRPNLDTLLQHEIFDVDGINLESTVYMCDDVATIRVRDSAASGSVDVSIVSDTEPAGETVVLPETEPGLFEADFTLTSTPPQSGDSMLSVSHGDTVTATYAPMTDSDEAGIDCMGPVISDIRVTGIEPTTARFSWTTDEPGTSVIRYGTGIPDHVAEAFQLVTDHELIVEDLGVCTEYHFEVESSDSAGNVTVDDNGGSYHTFITWETITLFQELLDSDPGWQISGGLWAYGQPTGGGGEHGYPDPTAGYTGANVYGYNLNGDYTNGMPEYDLTTNAIDLTGHWGTRLQFWRWLGVEQPSYDHAHVRVSTDGSIWNSVWSNTAEVADNTWTLCEYDISQWADDQPTVYIRWTIGVTDSAWVYCGWNIDDIMITTLVPCGGATPTPTAVQPTDTPAYPTNTPVSPTETPVSPTDTPVPSTETPVPPTDTPVPPTETPVPPTETPVPPTETPVPPTETPVPPTETPVPPTETPICDYLGVRLEMPEHVFRAGDSCWLKAKVCYPDQPLDNIPLFVILDVYGFYWLWPSWIPLDAGIDFYTLTGPAGYYELTVIEPFDWPAGVGSADGLYFHGAITDPQITMIYGELDSWEFAYR